VEWAKKSDYPRNLRRRANKPLLKARVSKAADDGSGIATAEGTNEVTRKY